MQDPDFANPKLRHLPVEVRSNTGKNEVIGGLLALSIWLIILISIITLVVSLIWYAKLGGCHMILLILANTVLVARIHNLSRRYLANPRQKLLGDSRDPVLYLRPFDHDLSIMSRTFDKETPEEKLGAILDSVGLVLAIGKPGEKGLPFLGATRVYVSDSNWQQVVEYLMTVSKLVVISAGMGEGLIWELRVARNVLKPDRLFISFLHWRSLSADARRRSYEQFSSYFEEIFGQVLPADSNLTALMYFDADWTPRPIEVIFEQVAPYLITSLYARSTPTWGIKAGLVPILKERGFLDE